MVYIALCEMAEKEKALAKGARNDGVQEGFFAVPLMTAWGNGFIPRSVQRICWGTPLPHRHPERSRGIFPAHWYSVLCATAENGKPSVKGARKSRVQGRFLAALEMTVWGEWVYST